jgi:hypothetical protein
LFPKRWSFVGLSEPWYRDHVAAVPDRNDREGACVVGATQVDGCDGDCARERAAVASASEAHPSVAALEEYRLAAHPGRARAFVIRRCRRL